LNFPPAFAKGARGQSGWEAGRKSYKLRVKSKRKNSRTGFTGSTGFLFGFPRMGKPKNPAGERSGLKADYWRSCRAFSRSRPESGKDPVDPVNPVGKYRAFYEAVQERVP
jgi:hypothetical protein